jgi:hypothetical protein
MSFKSLDRRMTIFATLALLLVSPFSLANLPSYRNSPKKLAYSNGTSNPKAPRLARNSSSNGTMSSSFSSKEEMPRWEFRTAPVAYLARWYTLDVSYRISEKWATGPAGIIYGSPEIGHMFAPSYKGYAAGWNANYYFNTVLKSGWYLSMHSFYEKYSSYPHAYLGHKEIDGFRANAVAGYQWRWSAFNLMAGLGGEYNNHNVVDKPDAIGSKQPNVSSFNGTSTLLHIELKIGVQI